MLKKIREWLFTPKIENSCGCVFCDLDLDTFWHDGYWWHCGKYLGTMIQCTNPNKYI
jgi:hypothetical protein